jgi:hypothetical protein
MGSSARAIAAMQKAPAKSAQTEYLFIIRLRFSFVPNRNILPRRGGRRHAGTISYHPDDKGDTAVRGDCADAGVIARRSFILRPIMSDRFRANSLFFARASSL